MGLGDLSYHSQSNSECCHDYLGSQSVGAKLHAAKGKHPRSQSKVPKFKLSVKGGVISQTAGRLA